MVKNSPANAEDSDSIPESGRSPGGGNGNPLWYSCLENPKPEEPCGLQFMGSKRVRHDCVTKHRSLQFMTQVSHATSTRSPLLQSGNCEALMIHINVLEKYLVFN